MHWDFFNTLWSGRKKKGGRGREAKAIAEIFRIAQKKNGI